MKRPPKELVDAFLKWYLIDPHSKNEDHYAGVVTKKNLESLSREDFIQFFFQFAHDGGMVQSGGERTASRFRKTVEDNFDEFRSFTLEPFNEGFDELTWLENVRRFSHFGQGLATIYLNRVDKTRFAVINNKAVEAVKLFGVTVPSVLLKKYVAVRDAEQQLIEWYPEFENLYKTDALSQFLIGEKVGKKWKAFLEGETTPPSGDTRYWIIAPGKAAALWEECQRDGIIRVGWDELKGDLSEFDTEEKLRERYKQAYSDLSDFKGIQDFVNVMKTGERLFVKNGMTELIGYGEVTSGYSYDDSLDTYRHFRQVNWLRSGNWRLPDEMKKLPRKTLTPIPIHDTARVNKLLKVMEDVPQPADDSAFSPRAFELLSMLQKTPKASVYTEHQNEFKELVEQPFQSLLNSVAARLRPEITEVMETEKRIFSKIVKNDWGRGGAWSFYWGAFYPKGGKRIRDAQLFVVLHRDRLDFGFYIGEYGAQQRIRFMNECQSVGKRVATLLEANLAKLGISYGDLPDEKDDELELSIPSLSLGDWIDRVDQAGIRAAKELDKDQVLAISSESLVDRIVETFEALFPFVLIATQEEPLPHIQRYLAQESIEEQENPVYTVEEFAEETHMEPVAIQKWIRALKRKKQVIFYGPPGTGKTYVAQRLGKHLIGGGDGFYEVLQFHPSYAYEDFIQGLRPKAVKGGGLEYSMLPGRFKEFCESARTCTGPCALIIDEINRANLARVFGELMYLLEYRDGWVPLAGGERFQIPSNAYIVGTMNTADRSIALVDHALRRRFAFIGLYPDYDVLRRYHENTGFAPDGLVTVLERLNGAISDRHYAVGISFFLDPEIDAKVADIWEMEIEPYIEELFFDQVDKAASFSWSKVKSDILGA